MSEFTFFLGTHQPNWLELCEVPMFVSRRRLFRSRARRLPWARCRWALDSGGFSELGLFGGWRTTPQQYVREVRRCVREIGRLAWAAIQDWMCEPFMVERTGLTVAEHQRRTVESYLTLRRLAPDLPWVPVLQGYEQEEYFRHVTDYAAAGVDLRTLPVVGLGSVCRRQHTEEVEQLARTLHAAGIRLHGFGLKIKGLERCWQYLVSADSMAWSRDARYGASLLGCQHRNCANCLRYALRWRAKVRRVYNTH